MMGCAASSAIGDQRLVVSSGEVAEASRVSCSPSPAVRDAAMMMMMIKFSVARIPARRDKTYRFHVAQLSFADGGGNNL